MPSIWSYSDYSLAGYGLFKRNLLRVLKNLGWEIHLAEASLQDPTSKFLLRRHLQSHPTDWVLLINQTAAQWYDYLEIPNEQRPLPIKKLVWFLDDPHFFVTQPFEELEWVFGFDETYLDFLASWKPRVYGFLPLAADYTELGTYQSAYACEISFVGGVIDQSERRKQLNPAMTVYVNQLVHLKLEQRQKSFVELAYEHPIAPGKSIQITPSVAHYLYWEANNLYRMKILESLMDYDLRIYGNEDWKILLQDSPLRDRYHGPADPLRETPQIYASSTINLNIHSLQCRGSLNQRDFNAPAAGGFLLSDWVPAAGKYFLPGKEALYWSDILDLRRKISYYLKHPEARQKIITLGRLRILHDHIYEERIQELVPSLMR